MESTSFLIYEKIKSGDSLTKHEILVYFIVIPLIGILMTQMKEMGLKVLDYIKPYFEFKNNTLTLSGREIIHNSCMCFEYPESMLALNHWLQLNKKITKFRVFNSNRNGDYFYEDIKRSMKSENCAYIAEQCKKTKIDDDLYLSVTVEKFNNEGKKEQTFGNQTSMTLSSKKRNLNEFLENILEEYQKFIEKKNNGKLFHFLYQGWNSETNRPEWSKEVISEKTNPSHETFEHIINEHTGYFKRDIQKLKDMEYYRKSGLKRKKGYLFYGHPGCGKTASVMAMAIEDNRHIIEVPISRVEKNKEIENILKLAKIDNIPFRKDEIIILFDEIDCGCSALKEREKEPEIDLKNGKDKGYPDFMKNLIASSVIDSSNKDDKLNLGMMLSRLDGIGNYNGLIIVATTNHKEKLDPAMYRELRLSPVFFDYSRKEDIIVMMEKFYKTTLTQREKNKIPDRNAGITPAKVRWLFEKYENSLEDLLTHFAKIAN